MRCKLDHTLKQSQPHRTLQEFYQELIKLRKSLRAFARLSKEQMEVRVFEREKALQIRRWCEDDEALILANFSAEPRTILMAGLSGNWHKQLDSADRRWRGPGSVVPSSFNSTGRSLFKSVPKVFYGISKGGVTSKLWDTFAFTDIFTSRRARIPGSKPLSFRTQRVPITIGMNGSMLNVTRPTPALGFWTRKSALSAL